MQRSADFTRVYMTTTVSFSVPEDRADSCTSWLSKQEPVVVADCLDLTETIFHALQREVGEGAVLELRAVVDKFEKDKVSTASAWRAERAKLEEDHANDLLDTKRAARERELALESKAVADREALKASLKAEERRNVEDLETKCLRLNQLLQNSENKFIADHAKEKDLQQQQFMHQIEQVRRDKDHEMNLKNQALDDRSKLFAMIDDSKKEIQKRLDEIEKLNEKLNKEKDKYQEFASNFSSPSSQGKIGEDFVRKIHADMALGKWEDTSHRPEEGAADAMWELQFPNSRKMRALVEVKSVANLQAGKDLGKFENDVSQGVRLGTINAAVLISLRARISGTRPIQLSIDHGIPVVRMSREADDALCARAMVQLGLTMLSTTWPLLQAHREAQSDDALLTACCGFLDDQLNKAVKLTKNIDDLDKQIRTISRIAMDMRKTKESIVRSVETIRVQYPQLLPEADTDDEDQDPSVSSDPWDHSGSLVLLDAILNHRTQHGGRYPKALDDMAGLPDEARTFLLLYPGVSFKEIIQKAKNRAPKGRNAKRARADDFVVETPSPTHIEEVVTAEEEGTEEASASSLTFPPVIEPPKGRKRVRTTTIIVETPPCAQEA